MVRFGVRLMAACLLLAVFCSGLHAQDYSDIPLGPGETLVSVNGVPVSGSVRGVCRGLSCANAARAVLSAVIPGDSDRAPAPPSVAKSVSSVFEVGPGETLVAIDGVPVSQVRGPVASVLSIPSRVVQGVASRFEVMADARAYAHAKREAEIQASRGQHGHFLGTAPGLRGSGVGYSHSLNDPSHCTIRGGTLVARAAAVGRDGRVYWSAHYR